MKLALQSAFILVLLGLTTAAQALMPNVDLRDVVRYGSPQDKLEAKALMAEVNAAGAKFGLPPGLTYAMSGLSNLNQAAISTIEVQNMTPGGYDVYLIYSTGKDVLLNRVTLAYQGEVLNVSQFDLTRNPPTVQIDILNRQMFITEQESGYAKFAPVSLGSLVNNHLGDTMSGSKSLSPVMASAVLSRSKSELSRTKPSYYEGRPFLRILDYGQSDYGGFTPFGLHYKIGGVFERGFVSNGCFRLRDTDLYEMAKMVFFSKRQGVPISIVTDSGMGNHHPSPLINSWYNTPRAGIGPNGQLQLLKDEHGLYVFDKVRDNPEAVLNNLLQY